MSYSKVWLLWGAAALTSFAVIEFRALRSAELNATLSSNLRQVFGFTHDEWCPDARRLLFYASVGWLTHHIAQPRDARRA